jgi:hypothetical protein
VIDIIETYIRAFCFVVAGKTSDEKISDLLMLDPASPHAQNSNQDGYAAMATMRVCVYSIFVVSNTPCFIEIIGTCSTFACG